MSNGWTPTAPCAPPTLYLPLSGGTMTGPLILAADPVQPLEAATKQYVDAKQNLLPIGDNRIINGDMRIDQRGVASAGNGTASGYTVDRWAYNGAQANKGTWGRAGIGWPGAGCLVSRIALSVHLLFCLCVCGRGLLLLRSMDRSRRNQ